MAGPISSLTKNDSPDYADDDSALSCAVPAPASPPAEPLASTPEPLASVAQPMSKPSLPAGTQSLVARFSTPRALPKPVATGAVPVFTSSVMSTSSGPAPGGGSYHSATALKMQVEVGAFKTDLDVGTASIKTGTDLDMQVTAARRTVAMSGGGYGVTVMGDVGAARVNLGENNDDGGIGGNIGASAELLGAEVTLDTPVASVTAGLSVSWGASGSMDVRDKDQDGKPEFCAKFSVPAFTVGGCVEQFW